MDLNHGHTIAIDGLAEAAYRAFIMARYQKLKEYGSFNAPSWDQMGEPEREEWRAVVRELYCHIAVPH